MEYLLLVCVLFLVLFAEFINGWTDAPNAIATVVSTRALPPRTAILMAACLNIVGAFMGTAVATTIGRDIVEMNALDLESLGAAMVAIIFWGLLSWRFGLPISKSHALIAALSGAGLAAAGPSVLIWEGWYKVLLGLFLFTFLGGIGGWAIVSLIQLFFAYASPARSRAVFGRLQILSAGFMAYSHGSNDGQKFMGIFSLALVLGGALPSFSVPFEVILICAIIMGLGTSIGGMRIIRTMGFKIIKLQTYQGFSAETASASTIVLASWLGVPLSTTNTIGMAIVGSGLASTKKSVRWNIVGHMISAWVLTFPICCLLAYVLVLVTKNYGIPTASIMFMGICLVLWWGDASISRRKARVIHASFESTIQKDG